MGDFMGKYEEKILKLSQKAAKYNCVPVGALIVDKNGEIIAEGFNKKEITNNPLDHAEIIAIKKATKKNKSWKLNQCSLYVTMKPCAMCNCVINETRIKNVFYFVENKKEEYKNKRGINSIKFEQIKSEKLQDKYLSILRNFFSEKRKKTRKIDNNVI